MTEKKKPAGSKEADTHNHDHDHDHSHDHGHDHSQNPTEEHTRDMSKEEIFTLHTNHSIMHMNDDDFPGSWGHLVEALKIAQELKDNSGIASTLNSMGHVLLLTNDPAGALDHYTRGLECALEAGDSKETARSYHNLGTYYEREKDYTLSIESLLMSLAYQQDAGIDSRDTQNYLHDIRKTVKYTSFKELAIKVFKGLPEEIKEKVDMEEFTRDTTIRLVEPRTGRNEPCPCGSGKKYKKCCGCN